MNSGELIAAIASPRSTRLTIPSSNNTRDPRPSVVVFYRGCPAVDASADDDDGLFLHYYNI